MPLTGTVPSPFPRVTGGQTWTEHFSEALGHVIWLWSIELVRRDLRNRITHQPDPVGSTRRRTGPLSHHGSPRPP